MHAFCRMLCFNADAPVSPHDGREPSHFSSWQCTWECVDSAARCVQPKYVPDMIRRQAKTGADIVTGTRYAGGGGVFGWNFKRKLVSRGANFLAATLLQPGVRILLGFSD